MATFTFSETGTSLIGTVPGIDTQVSLTPSSTLFSAAHTYPLEVDDILTSVTETDMIDHEVDMVITPSSVSSYYEISVDASTSTIGKIVGNKVVRLSDGNVKININTPGVSQQQFEQQLYREGTATRIFSEFISGTLGRYLQDYEVLATTGILAGSNTQSLWSSNNYNATSPSFAWNPNFMLFNPSLPGGSVDLTCFGVDGPAGGAQNPPNLIGPRHIFFATHWPLSGPVCFLDRTGQYQKANIVRRASYGIAAGSQLPNAFDISVAYLDRDIQNCNAFKFLPSDWYKYFIWHTRDLAWQKYLVRSSIPVFTKQVTAGDLVRINRIKYFGLRADAGVNFGWDYNTVTNTAFQSNIIPGDSGSPHFLVINGEPVLISTANFTDGDTFLSPFLDSIAALMNATKDSTDAVVYAPQTVSLASFTSLPNAPDFGTVTHDPSLIVNY